MYPLISYLWYIKIELARPQANQASSSWISLLPMSSFSNQVAKVSLWWFLIQVSYFLGYLLRTVCLCSSIFISQQGWLLQNCEMRFCQRSMLIGIYWFLSKCALSNQLPLMPWYYNPSRAKFIHSQQKTHWPPLSPNPWQCFLPYEHNYELFL